LFQLLSILLKDIGDIVSAYFDGVNVEVNEGKKLRIAKIISLDLAFNEVAQSREQSLIVLFMLKIIL
jgi:hypothetical protein